MMRSEFKTTLSLEECQKRLTDSSDKLTWFSELKALLFFPGKEVQSSFSKNDIRLQKLYPYSSNPLRVTFRGRFIPSKSGPNIIIGKYVPDRFGLVFLLFWESAVITILGAVLIGIATNSVKLTANIFDLIMGMLIMTALPVFGIGMFLYGYHMLKRDKNIIDKFIIDKCLATQISTKQKGFWLF